MSGYTNYLGPQALGINGLPQNYALTAIKSRIDPDATDRNYPYGQVWINYVSQTIFMLSTVVDGAADWVVLSTSSGAITEIDADSGVAEPSSGVINLLGGPGVSTVASGNTVTINVFQTIEGSGTTTGAVTADILTLPLGSTPTSFSIDSFIAGFDSATPAGVAYAATAGARTTGTASALISTPQIDEFEDAALSGSSISFVTSGNTIILRVLGVAGKTINWNARLSYLSV